MIVEIKIEAATGHDDYPLLDLAEMLESISQELEQLTAEHDTDAVNQVDQSSTMSGILVSTDDGEAKATVTVHKDA